ncbi:DUF1741-domain-containing protein [Polyplosphaeria fusca]|uniref:DUF1741-domain-containing protein n=1 Tax=Polyplosphaeria fusca TaxID=682080 RepID=A0A9P4V0F8_9PLEO|nr:DUF1741-domain-containing protein [Polyplosphaeria fusca]
MEPSPLTQDSRPDIFQPKIVRLYEALFREDEDDVDLSEGFWEEFFLLRPDFAGLRRLLRSLGPDDLLHLHAHTQQLFLCALSRVRQAKAPADEVALETLTVFLDTALSKKYTNPSSDILSVLAGLHDADAVLSDFVATLDTVIRNGRDLNVRSKAIRAALSMTSSSFHTGLPTYFTHRDLFPSLMKFVQDCETSVQALPALYLLGVLVNYNKFEFQNPYRLRLDDFVNDSVIQKMITGFASTCVALRDAYVAVQDDLPEGWTLGSTLNYIGLGVLAPGSRPSTPVPAADEARSLFTALPGPEIGVFLAIYDFANANKLFCFNLVTMTPAEKGNPSPLGSFLSLTSYLFQHAHRSYRSSLYTYLSLFILQILVEDQILVKRLCGDESKVSIRLCRQRQPYLPIVKGDRVAVAVILDLVVDGVNHNLRRRLDVELYILNLGVLLRILSYLSKAKARISYHWSELWRTLLSFMRFLSTYVSDIKPIYRSSDMVDQLVNVLAFALSNGENFLPDPAAYDDLFYKLVETGDIVTKFRNTFELASRSGPNSIQTLINVSSHYRSLLESGEKKSSKILSPREVSTVIKQGYETLSIESSDGLDRWEKYREADMKVLLKKIARAVVDDARVLVEEKVT